MFQWIKERFKKSNWTLKYTVERTFGWKDSNGEVVDIETMTYYLEEDENGNRRFSHYVYGKCKQYKKHELFKNEIILWQKTGIVPERAKNVIVEKLKGTIQ